MANVIKAELTAKGKKFAIVISRFNEFISAKLLEGCLDMLVRHGAQENAQDVVWVPGAFELPLVAKTLAETGRYAAVVCLGAVIRGETSHYDLVANEAARGIMDAGLSTGLPIVFGVVTTETVDQAMDRAGGKHGNKGWDAAAAAADMVRILREAGRT